MRKFREKPTLKIKTKKQKKIAMERLLNALSRWASKICHVVDMYVCYEGDKS